MTLVEVMITLAITAIIASVGARILIQMTRVFRMNTARMEIQRDARVAMGLMSSMLHEGRASTVTIDQALGQPPYSRLTFNTIEGSTVTYWQEGTELHHSKDAAGGILSKNLRYLAFTFENTGNDDVVSLSITMERATYEGQRKALQLAVEKVRILNE